MIRKPAFNLNSCIGVLTLLLLAASSLSAQSGGRLTGSVVDPTGAVIPGATVNVYLQGGKEPVLSGTTNGDGLFAFTAVRPDTYEIGVEAKGFNPSRLTNIGVAAIQETPLPPIKLNLASVSSSVEVSAEVQTVGLANATVSTTITTEQIQNLPVLGRQVTTLFQTQAGLNVGADYTSVNGTRPSFTNVTMDGINIQDNFIRANDLDYPPLRTTIDQIAEITVSTSNPDASLGGGASQIVLTTKSGTNTYHGSVYWYNRNSALSANDWFNNKSGVPVTFLDLNQVGASLGGHIIRDKLFFYANPEFYRNKAQSSTLRTVLTDNAKNGLFTYNVGGAPKTVNLLSLRNFAINPAMKALISQLPSPNSTDTGDGLNTSGYRFNARSNESRDQIVLKGDYYLNARQSFSATYNRINNPTDRPTLGAFYTIAPPVANVIKDTLLALVWRSTITNNLTNEVRGGFLRTQSSFIDSNAYPSYLVGGLVFNNPVNTMLNQGRTPNNYHIQDNAHWLKGRHEISFGFQAELLTIAVFNDASTLPTYTLGISAANTTGLALTDIPGGTSANLTTANNLYANLAGIISTAAQTFNVTSTTSGFVTGATNLRDFRHKTYAGYVQDNWKARRNLTVNLGLRYEYWTPLDEINSLYLTPRLGATPPATVLDPNAVLDFTGSSVGRPLYKADKNNFAPGIGFALDPNGKGTTSIRGGYSIGYAYDNLITTVRNNAGTASGLSSAVSQQNLAANLASPPTISVPVFKVPRTLADNYALSTVSAVGLTDPNLVTPYLQQWNFGIEHNYKGAIFSVHYVGNKAGGLLRGIDYNQVLYNANGFLADFKRAQSNAALSQAANGAYNGTYNPSIAGSQPLTVFPLLANGGNLTSAANQTFLRQGEIGSLADSYMTGGNNGSVAFYTNPNIQGGNVITNGGHANYNGLQIDVTKRTRNGLQMQFNYTFSKALSNTAGNAQADFEPLLDNANPNLENARAPFDVRHAFKSNYYYELPYGKGKKWSGNKLMNGVLGGWALAGITTWSSGEPYTILSGRGTLNRAARSTATNTASLATNMDGSTLQGLTSGVFMTGNGPYFLSPTLIGPDGRGASAAGTAPFAGQIFFNPDAGTVGNLQRRMFSTPSQFSWDSSLKKQVNISDRQSVELHVDVFNWLNHPTFYLPPSNGDIAASDTTGLTNSTINNTTFGKLTEMNFSPRRFQFGLYYRF